MNVLFNHRINLYFTIVVFLFLNATNLYGKKSKIVEKAIFALNNQIALNEYYIRIGATDKLKYVVDIRDDVLQKATPIDEVSIKLKLNELYTDYNDKSDQQNARAYILISQFFHNLGDISETKGEKLELKSATTEISSKIGEIKKLTEEILYNSKLGSENKKGVLLHYCQGVDGLRSYWYDNIAFDQRFEERFVTNTVDFFFNKKDSYIYTDSGVPIDIGKIINENGKALIEYLKNVNTDNYYSQTIREPLEIKNLEFNQYTIRISSSSPLYAAIKDALLSTSSNRNYSNINDFAGILENVEALNSIITSNQKFKACIFITSDKKRPLTGENATQLAYEKSKVYAGQGTVMGLHVFEESESSILATLSFYLSTDITSDDYSLIFQNGIEPFLKQEESLSSSLAFSFAFLANYNYSWAFSNGSFKISETWWDYPDSGLRPFIAGIVEAGINDVAGLIKLLLDITRYSFDSGYRAEVDALIGLLYDNRVEVAAQLSETIVQSALNLNNEDRRSVYNFGKILLGEAMIIAPSTYAAQSQKMILTVLRNISTKFMGKGKWLAELILKSAKLDIPYKLAKNEIVFYSIKVGDFLQTEIARVKEGTLIIAAAAIEELVDKIPEASLFFPSYRLLTETGEEIKIPVILMKAANGSFSVKRISKLTQLLVDKYKYQGLTEEIADELINSGLGKYLVQNNSTQLVLDLVQDKTFRNSFNSDLAEAFDKIAASPFRKEISLLELIKEMKSYEIIVEGDVIRFLDKDKEILKIDGWDNLGGNVLKGAGNLVPSSLITKLTQQGVDKLKAWMSGKSLNYKSLLGTNYKGVTAEAFLLKDLENVIGSKNVLETFEDAQGRFLVRTNATAIAETKVICFEKTVNGEYRLFEYKAVYSKGGQSGYPPLSDNGLAPDFSKLHNSNTVLFPVTGKQQNIVKIKLTGKRNGLGGDFDLANQEAKLQGLIPSGKWKPDDYTWHHLDDFNPITEECTMQLVKTSEHIKTIPHTGSVKQWENYKGLSYGN